MWFGASDATFSYANTYVTIYTAGTFFALISGGMNSFLIAQGFSGLGMATVVIGAALNILLDPLFIFIFHLGVAGAAIATVIFQIVSCLFVLGCLFSKRMPVRLGWGDFHLSVMKWIVTFGFSPFLILASDSILLIVLNTVLQRHGGPGEGDTLVTFMIIPLAVQYPLVDETTALGKVKLALFCSAFRKCVFLTGLILLPALLTADAAFFSEPVADVVSATMTSCLFFHFFPKILKEREGMTI